MRWLEGEALELTPAGPTDEALIEAVASGSQEAVAQLYDRHGAALYGFALRITSDATAAEEVIQDVFVDVWRAARTFDRRRGKVSTWLYTITRNRALDFLRRTKGMRERLAPAPAGGVPGDGPGAQRSAAADPADEAETRVLADEVRSVLAGLPQASQDVVELAYFKGYSHAEIAEVLGIPIGTVKSRLRLAIERLRDAMVPPTAFDAGSGGDRQP